ncbi:MAG: YmdB family metallophosphoesterase [Rhodospirillaceae bacterium]|jgi:2',3'-cyclic-nucleotide 2'-phosphodiesterase|nr:YmdB family metallophosphoesterase [Rhodospirillaceae bacterium]MBT5245625.1 YmdB family metallophosphoesterase [Rhodospirillaceae bacterium]MBT5562335.1 YmdB family metallophosphoesterase [Rhodospirillaceae bacterium]MBT6242823.1 YmdB family metallophosphoesterase [Rhodospirillaceae bacterium]MBT7138784.1 YmdB family metallophosphoesterase [Rhodospirillaceae bacterium]
MRILMCGDVVGKSGRQAILYNIEDLRARLALDFVLVNGENAAHGFGISEKICATFYQVGVDVITTGNHVWDQREIMNYIDSDPRLLRPINYPARTPGAGSGVFETQAGKKVLVIHPMGRLFMDPLDDPFLAVENVLEKYTLGQGVDAIIVDMHAEATSEKMAMGHHCDGRASVVVGSHSHIPTADAQILPGGTAYQTDMGMCGDYNSVIGMIKETAVARFTSKLPAGRLEPASEEATLCAVLVETDDTTGLAKSVEPVRLGGRLAETVPG